MNVNQMFADRTAAVALSTAHQFVSVYRNTKEIHQAYHANHQRTLVQFRLVDQTRNALVSAMELLNAHVFQVSLKVRIRFVAVSNQKVLANHSHAVLEHLVMLHEIQFAIVQNRPLEIHSENVAHQLLRKNCVDRAHVEVN